MYRVQYRLHNTTGSWAHCAATYAAVMVMVSGAPCYLGQRVLVGYYFHLSSSKTISSGFNVRPQACSDRDDMPPLKQVSTSHIGIPSLQPSLPVPVGYKTATPLDNPACSR